MANIIRIKRRLTGDPGAPATLSGGELAFNEVDSVLYYGAQDGLSIEAIAGPGAYVDRTTNQTISGEKTFEDPAHFNSDVNFQQNVTVVGNLSVLGDTTTIDTFLIATSAIEVTNAGTGPALKATQLGAEDVAAFYDDESIALVIKDGGNVGIGTNSPEHKLTVAGSIAADQDIFAVKGNFTDTLTVTGRALFETGFSTLTSSENYIEGNVHFGFTRQDKTVWIYNQEINHLSPGGTFSFSNGILSNSGHGDEGETSTVGVAGNLVGKSWHYPSQLKGFIVDGGSY